MDLENAQLRIDLWRDRPVPCEASAGEPRETPSLSTSRPDRYRLPMAAHNV